MAARKTVALQAGKLKLLRQASGRAGFGAGAPGPGPASLSGSALALAATCCLRNRPPMRPLMQRAARAAAGALRSRRAEQCAPPVVRCAPRVPVRDAMFCCARRPLPSRNFHQIRPFNVNDFLIPTKYRTEQSINILSKICYIATTMITSWIFNSTAPLLRLGHNSTLLPRALSTSAARLQQRLLVVADHNNEVITPITFNAIAAASKIGGPIELLLVTNQPDKLVPQVEKAQHVNKILVANHKLFEQLLAERMAPVVIGLHNKSPFTHITAGANAFGSSLLPRIAAKLNVQPITGVVGIPSPDTFIRPIYGGQAIQTYKSKDPVKIFSARATAFQKVEADGGNATVEEVEILVADIEKAAQLSQVVGQELNKSERPDLTSASKVVSGGRGLKSKENFDLVFKLAEKLGAAVGASRAAVDAGYVPNDMQVGQTGKMIAPELYVAVGISGAIQHLSGMKDSKTIVAINKDPEAPIFQVADLGLEADLFKAVPELTEKI